jgi:bacterioferritin
MTKNTSPTNTSASKETMDCLNRLLQAEMAGVIRYLHYSFMIMGHNRIPIQGWFRNQASESMAHATRIGEKITALGGHPPVAGAKVEEHNLHTVSQLLTESLRHEEDNLKEYIKLVKLATDEGDIALEEMAREFVMLETEHVEEVKKMLVNPH